MSIHLEQLADDKRSRVETLAQAPMWLFSPWHMAGQRQGTWNRSPPSAVIAHALAVGGRDDVIKQGIFRLYNWWHWSVDDALHGPGLLPSATKVCCSTLCGNM